MTLWYNIPFLTILLVMASALLVPLLKNGARALDLVRGVQLLSAAGSAWLLWVLSRTGVFPVPALPDMQTSFMSSLSKASMANVCSELRGSMP